MKIKQPQFGKFLRKRRGEWPIGDFALMAGVHKSQVSVIERGSDLQLSTMNKILKAHGLELCVKSNNEK